MHNSTDMKNLNTILKTLFVKSNKFIIKTKEGKTKIFNIELNFFYIALGLAVCLSIIVGRIRNEVVETDKVLIEHTANNLFTHVEGFEEFNTILKTDTDYHTYALTTFKTNPYVAKLTKKEDLDEVLTFFSNAANNKTITAESYKKVSNLVLNSQYKESYPTQVDLDEIEKANLLGSYLRLEFFKSKAIAIEANFIKKVLTLVSDSGEPILIPYENQKEYDRAASYWLSTANKYITDYLEQKESITNTIVAFMQTNTTPKLSKFNPMYSYRNNKQKAIIAACNQKNELLAIKISN